MGEVMTQAIIGMPYEMAMSDEISRRQFHDRAQYLLGEHERLQAELAKLRAELERLVPEGWSARRIKDGYVVSTPRDEAGVRSNTSVWADDDDPAHAMLWHMLAATSAPKADDPVKVQLLEALEKVDNEHEILGWMKTCELRRGRGSFGIAVMSDELALDWQSHQKNLERLIGLRRAAIAAARKGE